MATLTGCDACPPTVTTTGHDDCPAVPSGMSALICQLVEPFAVTGPESYESTAAIPQTETLAPPTVTALALAAVPAPPRFCPRMLAHAPGESASDWKSAPFTTAVIEGAGGVAAPGITQKVTGIVIGLFAAPSAVSVTVA